VNWLGGGGNFRGCGIEDSASCAEEQLGHGSDSGRGIDIEGMISGRTEELGGGRAATTCSWGSNE
jgi:hypothetical protein